MAAFTRSAMLLTTRIRWCPQIRCSSSGERRPPGLPPLGTRILPGATHKVQGVLKKLVVPVSEPLPTTRNKVSIIGVGQVGMTIAFSLVTQGVVDHLALVDRNTNRLEGEMMDLEHGMSSFLNKIRVDASSEYAVTAGSKVCIIAAGTRQKPGESRLHLAKQNVDILKEIVPELVRHCPDTVLLVVSNPVDIMTHATWKLSGLGKHRVFGTGTSVDTSRFRFLVGERLGLASNTCHGWVIGEHGDTSVPVWSGLTIAGVKLADLNPDIGQPDDKEYWQGVHDEVVRSAYKIIAHKGYTCWGSGLVVAALTRCILKNLFEVHPVSTLIQGHYGIEDEVFLSLPCALGENGINCVIKPVLTDKEVQALHKCAEALRKARKDIDLFQQC